ncbi:uncharacterized protein HaLaN_25258, partial [Haematococcus lacustris]
AVKEATGLPFSAVVQPLAPIPKTPNEEELPFGHVHQPLLQPERHDLAVRCVHPHQRHPKHMPQEVRHRAIRGGSTSILELAALSLTPQAALSPTAGLCILSIGTAQPFCLAAPPLVPVLLNNILTIVINLMGPWSMAATPTAHNPTLLPACVCVCMHDRYAGTLALLPELRSEVFECVMDATLPASPSPQGPCPVYLALVDISGDEEFLEVVRSGLLAALEVLPPYTQFGLITFSNKVGLHDLRSGVGSVRLVHALDSQDGPLAIPLAEVTALASPPLPAASSPQCRTPYPFLLPRLPDATPTTSYPQPPDPPPCSTDLDT